MTVKIRFNSGKEIELTAEELTELFSFHPYYTIPQPIPYYPAWDSKPWIVTYDNSMHGTRTDHT